MTAVSLSRVGAVRPLQLSFSTTAPLAAPADRPGAGRCDGVLPTLTLSVRHGPAGRPVRQTFVHGTVNAFTENLSTPFSGTASLDRRFALTAGRVGERAARREAEGEDARRRSADGPESYGSALRGPNSMPKETVSSQ